MSESSTNYLVAYAKIVMEKNKNVILDGVYFGGIAESAELAEKLAIDCVNNTKGGTIITKIKQLDSNNVIDGMFYLEDKFESIVKDMREACAILNRTRNC